METTFTLSELKKSYQLGYLVEDERGYLVRTANGYPALRENCTEINGDYYHTEQDADEIGYDEINDEYVLSSDLIEVITGRNRNGVETKYTVQDSDFIRINGDWYTIDGAEECDYVCLHNGDWIDRDYASWVESEGEYYHTDDCYYWDCDNEWHLEPEPDGGLFEYHSNNRKDVSFSRVRVGFEVEKEDGSERDGIDAPDLFDETGWAAERDGSLCNETGFELVSPTFDLHGTDFAAEFEKVKSLVNADYSDACGGHINYSNELDTPTQMAESVSGYFPLLYAMYPKRVGTTYCKAKSKKEILTCSDKYQSVSIKSNRIEFRIFPAVQNVRNLLFRTGLIQVMDKNRTANELDVLNALCTKGSDLSNHLRTIYTDEKLIALVGRFARFMRELEGMEVAPSAMVIK
jgi:hypothetical protein